MGPKRNVFLEMAPKMDKKYCLSPQNGQFFTSCFLHFSSPIALNGAIWPFLWANFVLNKLFLLGPLKNFVFKLHQTADKFVKIF